MPSYEGASVLIGGSQEGQRFDKVAQEYSEDKAKGEFPHQI